MNYIIVYCGLYYVYIYVCVGVCISNKGPVVIITKGGGNAGKCSLAQLSFIHPQRLHKRGTILSIFPHPTSGFVGMLNIPHPKTLGTFQY